MATDEDFRERIPLEWLPTITRRYLATVLDGIIIVSFYLVPTSIWVNDSDAARR